MYGVLATVQVAFGNFLSHFRCGFGVRGLQGGSHLATWAPFKRELLKSLGRIPRALGALGILNPRRGSKKNTQT